MTALPVFKAHLRVEIIPEEGVLVLSEDGARALYGKVYELVVPFIDGSHDADAIVDALADKVEAAKVYYALALLEKNGFVVESTPEIAPQTAAYWHALGIEPRAAMAALAAKRVRVRAVGNVNTAPLHRALGEAGISLTSDDSADLEIVATDDYLRGDLAEINASALKSGRPWLLLKPVGIEPWIGPLYLPTGTGCHRCLHNRLERHRPVYRFAAEKKKLSEIPVPPSSAISATFNVACEIATVEAAKFLVGAACGLDGKVLSLDTRIWAVQTHALLKHPHCEVCGTPSDGALLPVTLVNRKVIFRQDGGHRVVTPEETVKKYQHLVSPITGVVPVLMPVHSVDGTAYVYAAGQNLALRMNRLDYLKRSLRNWSAGKGMSDSQAKASALCEAIEHSSGAYTGSESRITASYSELGEDAIHPGDVMRYSETQYREREVWNGKGSKFNIVPDAFDEDTRIDWTPLWSLSEERHKYLPTQLLYFRAPASAQSDKFYCMGCSNGNASGNTIEEAILQGFLELVERDATALWWYNRLKKPRVDVASFGEPRLLDLAAYYDTIGREVWALDITSDMGIPVVAAVSRSRQGPQERILFGLGCHFEARIALQRAFGEMHQMLGNATGGEDGELNIEDPETLRWLSTATGANQPYLMPDETVQAKRRTDFAERHSGDLLDDILLCKRLVEERGMEMLVLDQTRVDVGMPVAKVVVPGMRHFWARYAPGRLYDVPVKMGWLDKPLREDELNPIPVFI